MSDPQNLKAIDSSFVGWVGSTGRWFPAFGALVSCIAGVLAVIRTAAVSAQQIQDLAVSVGGYVQTAQFVLLLPALVWTIHTGYRIPAKDPGAAATADDRTLRLHVLLLLPSDCGVALERLGGRAGRKSSSKMRWRVPQRSQQGGNEAIEDGSIGGRATDHSLAGGM